MKKYFLFTLVGLLLSCSTTKSLDIIKLNRGNLLYSVENVDENGDMINESTVRAYKSKRGARAKLNLENKKLTLEPYNLTADFDDNSYSLKKDIGDTGGNLKLLDKFSKSKNVVTGNIEQEINSVKANTYSFESTDFEDTNLKQSGTLRYSENKLVFQTLSIPLKIRGKEGDFPSTVSTNFNAGIAYGHQWNLSRVNPIYNEGEMVGYEKESISFSLAPFFGLTSVALTAENTNPDISISQTVMGYSFGAAGVFSFNRLNLGLALGIDHGFGNAENWIYQDKLWTGIVIGLDLIK
ncbi:hypothetical protein [Maribacter sp. IgM3_T14_3]|uniref:hypothetical protein n=1 Tax=Maribacter sp. IgM3_T14_3 TaxID=3415140 RepID=UPI003C6F91BE